MENGLQLYDLANQPTSNPTASSASTPDASVITLGLRRLVDEGRKLGMSDNQLRAAFPDLLTTQTVCMPGTDASAHPPVTPASSADIERLLKWIGRSLETNSQLGKPSKTPLILNPVKLPHPRFGFKLSPEQASFGAHFPAEWASELVGHGIWKVKVSLEVRPIKLKTLNLEQVKRRLYERLVLSVIHFSTSERTPFSIDVEFGEVSDAQGCACVPSTHTESAGYYFPQNTKEFVPWAFDPSEQAYDLSGLAPGNEDEDEYELSGTIRSYARPVV